MKTAEKKIRRARKAIAREAIASINLSLDVTTPLTTGFVAWSGRSKHDGAPIVAIVTGVDDSSNNPKTGRMRQLWILRADMKPIEASRRGLDASTCGNCKLRWSTRHIHNPADVCYVNLGQGPQAVYDAWQRGVYPTITDPKRWRVLLSEFNLRLGAYGDPAMLPIGIVRGLAQASHEYTGYTHQWREHYCASDLKTYCMASCDDASDVDDASALGWRTFALRYDGEAARPDQIDCPAAQPKLVRVDGALASVYPETPKTNCDTCLICSGNGGRTPTNRPHVSIPAHGPRVRNKQAAQKRAADKRKAQAALARVA